MTVPDNSLLEADFELGFTYTRSPGIIIGKFLAALKQQQIYGIRANDGSVLFPPTEYDPRTAESLDDFVPLSDRGRLLYWTWIDQPRDHHQIDPLRRRLDRPRARSLVHRLRIGVP